MQKLMDALALLDRNDLSKVQDFCQRRLSDAWRDLSVGQRVQFRSSSNGAMISGTLVKINRKSLKITSKQGRGGVQRPFTTNWSVSPSMVMSAE